MSPTLFNILMDSLAERTEEIEWTDLGEEHLRLNMFADDVLLMAKNEDNLQNLLNVATKWGNETGMKWSPKKVLCAFTAMK